MINFGVIKSRLIDRYSGQHFFKHRQSKKKDIVFIFKKYKNSIYVVKYLVTREMFTYRETWGIFRYGQMI